jgi:alpha-tubulin suppressor-like RCC1 family protein
MSIFAITSVLLTAVSPSGALYVTDPGGGVYGAPNQYLYERPKVVQGVGKVIQAVAANEFSLAIQPDGTVLSWGRNNHRQLGQGKKKIDLAVATPIPNLPPMKAIAAGLDHSVAVTRDGNVWGWGASTSGQLGPTVPENFVGTPFQIPQLSGVVAIAAGSQSTLALKANGTVYAFGWNALGQLGLGNQTSTSTPTKIPGLKNVVAISASQNRAFALKADGTVVAWGENYLGQLGTADANPYVLSPSPVSGLSLITKIEAGDGFALALRDDGLVMSWGRNDYGQLGNPAMPKTYQGSSSPSLVPSLDSVIDISGGGGRSLAVKSDGSVWAAGIVQGYQVGDYTSTSFVPGVGIQEAFACSAGTYHTLVLSSVKAPIWIQSIPSSTVSTHGQPVVRITNEGAARVPITIHLSSSDPNLSVPETVQMPKDVESMDVPIEVLQKVTDYQTIRIWADGGEIVMGTQIEVQPETLTFIYPSDFQNAGDHTWLGFRLNFPAPAGGLKLHLSTGGDSRLTYPSTVTIPQGQTTATIEMDSAPSDNTYFVNFKAKGGGLVCESSLPFIGNVFTSVQFLDQNVVGGDDSRLKIVLAQPAPAGGRLVMLSQAYDGPLTLPERVLFEAGETEQTITVGTVPLLSDHQYFVSAANNSQVRSDLLYVVAPTIQSLTATSSQVKGGESIHLRIDQNGLSAGESIALSASKNLVQTPSAVNMPQGQRFVEFDVPTLAVAAETYVTIKATLRGTDVTLRVKLMP